MQADNEHDEKLWQFLVKYWIEESSLPTLLSLGPFLVKDIHIKKFLKIKINVPNLIKIRS